MSPTLANASVKPVSNILFAAVVVIPAFNFSFEHILIHSPFFCNRTNLRFSGSQLTCSTFRSDALPWEITQEITLALFFSLNISAYICTVRIPLRSAVSSSTAPHNSADLYSPILLLYLKIDHIEEKKNHKSSQSTLRPFARRILLLFCLFHLAIDDPSILFITIYCMHNLLITRFYRNVHECVPRAMCHMGYSLNETMKNIASK